MALLSSPATTKEWHASIGDPNHADALCDRLLHNAHRIVLKGRTMRNIESPPKNTNNESADHHATGP